MIKKKLLFLLPLLLITTCNLFSEKVGLLIVATGKYDTFVDPLIDSARKYFCKDHEVTYYVFTEGTITPANDVVQIFQERLGWPLDTLFRNWIYNQNREKFSDEDYVFALDADMLFVDHVGSEILGKRVATQHPGFVGKRGSYETDPRSLACIKNNEGSQYFAGGFFGGSQKEFRKIIAETSRRILQDLSKGIIAVWHDESHWNRYCIDFPPTVILNPSYCYPESWKLNYPKKLLALDKNHAEFQTKLN